MRNIDRIRVMPVAELAHLLVRTDYIYDESVYVSPEGCMSYSFEEALEETIEWLNKSS